MSNSANADVRKSDNDGLGRKSHGPSSPDRVVRALIDGLKSGRYVPGQRLIEADLSSELGLSRGPIREAFKHLAAEGVVSLIPHRGAYIRKLTRKDVHDILIIQERLTGLAARLAADNIGQGSNRAQFQKVYDNLMASRDGTDAATFLDVRSRFYRTLIQIADNKELSRLAPSLQPHLIRMQVQHYLTNKDRERQFQEYETIAGFVLGGNGRKAESAMEQHIRRSRVTIEQLPDSVFATEA
ncbi:MAG: GntR family transcriptional regulator [Alphaproteobacteria bacterium]|jgi:DNA-binding GntR family transcriptional regulator|nr:GntR family transcriptional regulator [Alphaproteobacteria bacterium]